jgi:beta-1,4-mannosyltransferase
VEEQASPEYDILIWGSQSPYKGVTDLLKYNYENTGMQNSRIVIAGKFSTEEFYQEALRFKAPNVTFINRVIEDDELLDLFSRSRFVLFCYRKNSVLSSAALAQTLSYGKTVIGPDAGAFKELSKEGLVYTYRSFEELEQLLLRSKEEDIRIDKNRISEYAKAHSWNNFKAFLVSGIKDIGTEKLSFPHEHVAQC